MGIKNKVRVLRAEMGITQAELAKQTDMSPISIISIEKGGGTFLSSAFSIFLFFKDNLNQVNNFEDVFYADEKN